MKCWLLVLAVVLVCANAQCNETTVFVSDETQLQSALMQAKPGNTIILRKGTYSGQFVLKDIAGNESCPIVIQAEKSKSAIIDISDRNGLGLSSVSYVQIQGLVFDKTDPEADSMGLGLDGSNYVTIEKCHFSNGDDEMLTVLDSNHNTIKSCTFENCGKEGRSWGACMRLAGDDLHTAGDNTITKCTFGEYLGPEAIHVSEYAYGVTISSCTFKGAGAKGSSWITVYGGCHVIDSSFSNPSGKKMSCGIYDNDNDCTVKGNTFDLNDNSAYAVYENEPGKVCASNKVINARGLTNGEVDPSC